MEASFEHSETIGNIADALVRFQENCPAIPKTESNPFLRSRYADLSGILAIIRPHLVASNLAIVQSPSGTNGLTTLLVHSSGEWMKSTFFIQPLAVIVDKESKEKAITPQSIGSAITYQRRYALQSMLSLNIEHDNDGGEVGAKVPKAAKPKSAAELLAEQAKQKETASGTVVQSEPAGNHEAPKQDEPPSLAAKGVTETGPKANRTDPCLDTQVKEVKQLLTQWKQHETDIDKRFVEKLHASGRKKIADLTIEECDALIVAISNKALDAFFTASLAK